ncbi:MAG TPA: hypothetical protein DCD97_05665 [Firmicutes bacterium]|nr:hypothetical protein [Peptococcaceae bacterium MAG4]NLW38126.1 hypothetical protein [Peptococcaceae bacterium]HAA34780.1 hypothetical protein [Bacillota bacterium]HPZ44361.1 hypothetical protein [Bacillota bacterium]HQD77006.1 hypothetical protein [Bacillota bacterium]
MTKKNQEGLTPKTLAKRFRDALNEEMNKDPVQHIREAFQQLLGETDTGDAGQKSQLSGTAVQDEQEQRNRKPWWSRVFRW